MAKNAVGTKTINTTAIIIHFLLKVILSNNGSIIAKKADTWKVVDNANRINDNKYFLFSYFIHDNNTNATAIASR